jgi:hypothetical protein
MSKHCVLAMARFWANQPVIKPVGEVAARVS